VEPSLTVGPRVVEGWWAVGSGRTWYLGGVPPIEVIPAFRALAIALVLGLLVGIQRERSRSLVAGVRTFSLVTLLGTCCAMLATAAGGSGWREGTAGGPPPEQVARAVASDHSSSLEPTSDAEADPDAQTGAGDRGRDRGGFPLARGRDVREPAITAEDSPSRWHLAPVGQGAWIIAAGALCIVSLAFLGNVLAVKRNQSDPGMSTEVAMLVMYAVGALAWLAPMEVAAAIGVGVAVLLHAKDALHRFTDRIGEKDVRAVLTFALITFIILPVVPNQTYGPFDVLNPYEAWRMVALVVGMSLAGYVATKLFGRGGGAIIAGLMGGLVSSTATTAAAARQTRGDRGETQHGMAEQAGGDNAGARGEPNTGTGDGVLGATATEHKGGRGASSSHGTRAGIDNLAATIILLATVVMYARVLVEIAVVTPSNFTAIAPPIVVLAAVTLVLGGVIWVRASRNQATIPESENPTQLKPAIFFGLMYAGVIFFAAAAEHYLGSSGLYAVAAISGLTDMDAITLSSARLVQDDRLAASDAWRAVLIAATANMVFKAGMIATLGSRGLLRRVVVLYGACAVVAIGLVVAWPASGASGGPSSGPLTPETRSGGTSVE